MFEASIDEVKEMVNNKTRIITVATGFILGFTIIDVVQAVTLNVDAKANIYGAGKSTPPSQLPGAGIVPPVYNFLPVSNQVLTFSRVTGIINYGVPLSNGLDGNDRPDPIIGRYSFPSLNEISGIIDQGIGRYLAGVFLDNSTPIDPAPVRLDFSGNHSFQELSPLLRQTFFIGDGLTGTGSGNIQKFNVPAGATRLFLGFFDGSRLNASGEVPVGLYNDNTGSFTAEFQISAQSLETISEPSNILGLIGFSLFSFGALWKHKLN